MKILAINGSPHPNGNTFTLLDTVLREANKQGVESEIYQLGGKPIRGCLACGKCSESQDRRCVQNDDVFNEVFEKMIAADAIVIGSPVYFSNMTPELKAILDRTVYVALANGGLLKRKIGAAVVAARRGGATHTFNSINMYFTISEMIIPGANYWNMGYGLYPGDVVKDEEGMNVMRVLGRNIAWLLEKIHA